MQKKNTKKEENHERNLSIEERVLTGFIIFNENKS
jgi:hypothetical protein